MPLFDKFQQQQMTHQPAPEQTDTYRAINQLFKDIGTGKVAKDAAQYYGQRATAALSGDPMARAELLSMYAPMGFLGAAGRVGKAATTTRRADELAAGLRKPMESPGRQFDDVMAAINKARAERADLLEAHRKTETIREQALRDFDRKQRLKNIKRGAIQDTAAIGTGGAAGLGWSEMSKALTAHKEKIRNTRKLQK